MSHCTRERFEHGHGFPQCSLGLTMNGRHTARAVCRLHEARRRELNTTTSSSNLYSCSVCVSQSQTSCFRPQALFFPQQPLSSSAKSSSPCLPRAGCKKGHPRHSIFLVVSRQAKVHAVGSSTHRSTICMILHDNVRSFV